MSVRDEILAALGNNASGYRRRELFALCDSAVDAVEVSNALRELKDDGLIHVIEERVGNKGPVYALGPALPAESNTDDHADFGLSANGGLETAVRVFEGFANDVQPSIEKMLGAVSEGLDSHCNGVAESDVEGDIDHFDAIIKSLVAIKTQVKPPRVVDNLELKLQCLNKLQQILNPEVAELLSEIAVDLEAAG